MSCEVIEVFEPAYASQIILDADELDICSVCGATRDDIDPPFIVLTDSEGMSSRAFCCLDCLWQYMRFAARIQREQGL